MNNKKIIIIAGAASVLGLFAQLIAVVNFIPAQWMSQVLGYIRVLSPNLELKFFLSRLTTYYNFDSSLELNFIDLALYLLLFTGLILYLKSQGKEIRLLRMTFAIILLSKSIAALYTIFAIFLYEFQFIPWITTFLPNLGWAYLSFFALRKLSDSVVLDRRIDNSDNTEKLIESQKSQRFTHRLIDVFLSIFICSWPIIFILRALLQQIESHVGERMTTYVVAAFSMFVYYMFFEMLFGATPAKFLTGSRVVNADGSKPKAETVFLRTLARFTPFEPFSYLGEGNGWHDKWLHTLVVKEKNNGVSAKKYLWIIPSFIVIGVLSFAGYELMDWYKDYTYSKNEFNKRVGNINTSLKTLSSENIIELEGLGGVSTGEYRYYLKVEDVYNDTVVFSYFSMEEYGPTVYEMEKYYTKNSGNLPLAKITKKQLSESYTSNYSDYDNWNFKGTPIIPSVDAKYQITEIHKAFEPCIYLRGTGSYGAGSLGIDLTNEGWKAYLISIENIEGDLEWINELPQEIKSTSGFSNTSMVLRANNFVNGEPYKFTFTVADSLDRKQTFLVEGVNSKREFRRIN